MLRCIYLKEYQEGSSLKVKVHISQGHLEGSSVKVAVYISPESLKKEQFES